MIAVPAIYRNRTFELIQPLELAEGQAVSLFVDEAPECKPLDDDPYPTIGESLDAGPAPDDDKPWTAEDFAEWEADMAYIAQFRMTDEEYDAEERERRRNKDIQIEMLRRAWGVGRN